MAVLAGGLGTRMAGRTGGTVQKVLLPVAGRPFIDHKLASLAAAGVERVVLLLGHGGDAVAAHVGDGSRFGLALSCLPDGDPLLGTGGAVRRALPLLGEVFWVTYGDTLLEVPVNEAEAVYDGGGFGGLMTVLHNRGAWDASNVAVSGGLVAEYRKGAPLGAFEYIDYGMSILSAAAFDPFPPGLSFDLGEVLRRLVAQRSLAAYEVTERFHEIGSEAGLLETEKWLAMSRAEDIRGVDG